MNSLRGYLSLSSKESDTKSDMEETGATGGNHPLTEFKIIMQDGANGVANPRHNNTWSI